MNTFFFPDRVSAALAVPELSVDQAVLVHRDPLVFASQVLGLKVCTSMHCIVNSDKIEYSFILHISGVFSFVKII